MSLAETLGAAIDADLQVLVKRHQVCFESYPIWHVPPGGGKVAIGYELDLIGTHDHPEQPPKPGCDECRPVREALMLIARSILPADDRPSRYAIEPVDTAIHFSPRRKMRKDIVLAIDVVHRGAFDGPIDACETRCLREMTEKLKTLGARPERW